MIKLKSDFKIINMSPVAYKKIEAINEKLKNDPNNLDLLMKKAWIYSDGYDDNNVFAIYQKIIKLYPQCVDTYFWLSHYLYRCACQSEEAIEVAKEGLKIDPNRADLYVVIAHAMKFLNGNKNKIIYFFKKAIALEPTLIMPRISLIEFLIKIKEFDHAKKEIKKTYKYIQDDFSIPKDEMNIYYEFCIAGRSDRGSRKTLQELLDEIIEAETTKKAAKP